jgi:hypothetical protein
MKASTTAGSNYVPQHLTISFMASSFEYFGLQGLSEVSASKVSASISVVLLFSISFGVATILHKHPGIPVQSGKGHAKYYSFPIVSCINSKRDFGLKGFVIYLAAPH